MKLASILTFVLLAAAKAPAPVAIVYSLTGTATLADRPLHRFDRLIPGAAVEVGPASHLALAFASGTRYELGERARVTIGKTDLSQRAGLVKALPRVPPSLILTAIAKEDKPGTGTAVVHIRGEEIDCLSPRAGAATLADTTVLHFRPATGASRYEVKIEDRRGNVVFQVVTESSAVAVPPGKLAAGASYHWSVKPLDKPGPGSSSGEADFVTLAQKAAADRERLRKAAGDGEDGKDLMETVDHALGMAEAALDDAQVFNSLGIEAAKRSEWGLAERLLKQALEIREALAPGGADVVASLNNLANVARHKGAVGFSGLAQTELLRGRKFAHPYS